MQITKIYKDIAQKLFDIFFVDDYKYGRQLENGSYHLIRERITPVTIEDMLINNKSLLTYQEAHTLDKAYIKWICIDLDISKKEIENNEINTKNLGLVKKSADTICTYLNSINIPYLLEFSGRRGFHIWIVFEELLTKEEGYYFISFILSKVELQENIIADKFPTVPATHKNSKGVGKGVKLPLSLNKVSNSLSYFIDDNNPFDFNQENWLSKPNNDFITNQLLLLNNFKRTSKEVIQPFLDEYIEENKEFLHDPILRLKKVSDSFLPNGISLEDIISSLKKCENLANLLKDYQLGLSRKERSILVGLLGNLKTENDSNFGYNLLLELFSNIKGFNKDITIKKLEDIKYYSPISCSYWNKCNLCKDSNCKITSPVQLIDGVILEDVPPFSIKNINTKLFNKLQKALHNYSLINDETPLFPQLEKINYLNETDIYYRIEDIYNGKISIEEESYKFLRNENAKIRELYNLSPKDNFISTYFVSVLNNLYYSEISNFSFGYQLSTNFYNENIFANWFTNWALFSKNIEQVLSNVEYDNHFLVKIDIKSFYDNIILQRLNIKLFEESPKRIRQKLDDLTKEDLNKYKHIIDYLMLLTKKVTGNNQKGLPQGPAYARYLAELYLLGLDQTIEGYIGLNKGREFYNRFVDDIYVFLDSEERAIELNNSIINWLTLNSLEVNNTKSEVVNVKVYRDSEKFKKYKDDAKYTINKVNKNKHIIPNEDIQSVLIQLENLTHDASFGLKDNLRFFFFQFQNDIRLKTIRRKLAKILPYSDDGRGTLYKIFYEDLLKTLPEYFIDIIENIDKINGLSLTHYLNTILFEWDNIENKEIKISQLIENISTKEGLSDADKLLILTISMKQDVKINEDFLKHTSSMVKKSVIETPNIKYTSNNYNLLEDNLRNISDNNLFLQELFRVILENEMTLEVAQNLATYSLIRFSIWSEQNVDVLGIEANLISYYHCLCFFTLFDTSEAHQNLTTSWENLLKKSEIIEMTTSIEFRWLNKVKNFNSQDFSRNSYSILLASTEGSLFNRYSCLNNFIEKYQGVVLLLLYSQNQDNINDLFPSITDYSDNSLFIQWLKNSNVSLYPNKHNECIQNLALNGLIVLQNNTEKKIFIKSIGKDINPTKYEFIEASKVKNNEFEYSINGYSSIESQLNNSNLVSFLDSLVKQIKIDEQFKNTYGNYPLFYNPVLAKDGNPLVPFYSNFAKAVSKDGVIVENNVELYWANLLNILNGSEKSNIKISTKNNSYNYSLNEFNENFFPAHLVKNDADKINFLKIFVENVNGKPVENIFDFQYYWTSTILKELANDTKTNKDLFIEYLNIHFRCFEKPIIDILFTVNDETKKLQGNLNDFFNTIKNSFITFQSVLSDVNSEISTKFENYLESEKDKFPNNDFSNFKITKIKYESDENELMFDGEIVDINSTVIFNSDMGQFQQILLENSQTINNRSHIYTYRDESKNYIYKPEQELIKGYEQIEKRFTLYNKPNISIEDKSLFPSTNFYQKAASVYEQYDTTQIELLLKTHYSNEINIKGRIVNWLSLLNETSIEGSSLKKFMDSKDYSIEKLYRAILECLSIHKSISDADISWFKKEITKYNDSRNYIIFPLKHPFKDNNGLKRLFDKCDIEDRGINVDAYVSQLCENSCEAKSIVIVADISISGTQVMNALYYYMRNYENNTDFIDNKKRKEAGHEKYFNIQDLEELKRLQNSIRGMSDITFVSPIMTEEFRVNVKKKMTELNINVENISWEYNQLLTETDCFLNKRPFDKSNLVLLMELLKDTRLIQNIFDIQTDGYNTKGIAELNTLLRVGSLPSKHIKLFSLKPKDGSKPLLDYSRNWKNKKS